MFKLTNSLGQVIFTSNYELSNENIPILDEDRYTFTICNNRWCMGSISAELFINDRLCKTVSVDEGKNGYIPFKTGIADRITIRIYKA